MPTNNKHNLPNVADYADVGSCKSVHSLAKYSCKEILTEER